MIKIQEPMNQEAIDTNHFVFLPGMDLNGKLDKGKSIRNIIDYYDLIKFSFHSCFLTMNDSCTRDE